MNNDIKEVHVLSKGLHFPVIIYVKNEKEHVWLQLLFENLITSHFDTLDVCKWCIIHDIQFKIFATKKDMISPFRRRFYKGILLHLEKFKMSFKLK